MDKNLHRHYRVTMMFKLNFSINLGYFKIKNDEFPSVTAVNYVHEYIHKDECSNLDHKS